MLVYEAAGAASHLKDWGAFLFGLEFASKTIKFDGDFSQAYRRIFGEQPYSMLLDSAGGPRNLVCKSIAAGDPAMTIIIKNGIAEISGFERKSYIVSEPLKLLRDYYNDAVQKLAGTQGAGLGFFGAIAYDSAKYLENLHDTCEDDLQTPDMIFFLPRSVMTLDHRSMELTVTRLAPEGMVRHELSEIVRAIQDISDDYCAPFTFCEPQPTVSREEFEVQVQRIIDYIHAGDVFQVNYSQRFSGDFKGNPWSLYQQMRQINPSPFCGFFNAGRLQLLCGSPERLVSVKGNVLQTRPIGGTCRRGSKPSEDKALAAKLLADPKERAEHVMLVDLERNDLGKSSELGSIVVDEFMAIERYSHVNHIVSNITGTIAAGLDIFDVLAGMFPGGTITGCPKVRCMEIIDECERFSRGFYTGSLGYIGFDGVADFNIIIRSIVIDRGRAHIQVGAGIVGDSKPAREFDETIEKAQAMFKALSMAGEVV